MPSICDVGLASICRVWAGFLDLITLWVLILNKYKIVRTALLHSTENSLNLHSQSSAPFPIIAPKYNQQESRCSLYYFIMQFKYTTAVFLASLICAQSAAIVSRDQISQQDQESGQELVLLSSEIIPAGNLTIWGVPDDAITATPDVIDNVALPAVDRRCGSNQVTCDSANAAYTTVCTALINTLSGAGVSTSPRSICLSQSGNQCCISWGNVVPGLVQNDLRNGANNARDRCGGGGLVSAVVRDANLHGVCTNQCLSNRPTGCPSA